MSEMPSTPPPPAPVAPAAPDIAQLTGWPKIKAYLRAREFWALAGILLGSGLLLLFIFFYLLLPLVTQQGNALKVPNVTSNSSSKQFILMDEGIRLIEEADLTHEIIDSGLFLPDFPPLAIISQEPEAGSEVKPGRMVYIKVNRRVPPKVKFPNVFDMGYNQARFLLENWKLRVGRTTSEPGMGDNLVLRAYYNGKQLKAGDMVPEQAQIDMVVSEGIRKHKVAVPSLVGKNLDEAHAILRALGLSIANVEFVNDSSQPQGFVVHQRPTARQDSVQAGSGVWLKVNGTPQNRE
ncbi:MAG: PASTA domain-containing protein [Bacteroidetes bacterium]|nr:PASTA domain-containing protein [Bacteroidota bacterium]